MNHRRCYQHAPLLGGHGPIHGESNSAATGKVGWDAAPISMSLGRLIHRESTGRRRRFLIHRESDLGEDERSACPWNASGLRGLRDCFGKLIHRESPIGEATAIPMGVGHRQSGRSAATAIACYPHNVKRRCRHSGIPIHRESPLPHIHRTAPNDTASMPTHLLSSTLIHRESAVPHIHRTAPNGTASMPTRPLSSTLIHRESEHPQEGPTS